MNSNNEIVLVEKEEVNQLEGEGKGMEEDSSSSSCLICLTSLVSSSTGGGGGGAVGAQQWKHLWSSNSNIHHHLPTPNSCGPRLATIFLVRNLLQVPREQVATLLSRTTTTGEVGVDPGAWCALCDNCAGLVEQAGALYQECLKLQRRVEHIGEQLRGRVKNGWKSGNPLEPEGAVDERGPFDVHAFIRNRVKDHADSNDRPPRKRSRPTTTRTGGDAALVSEDAKTPTPKRKRWRKGPPATERVKFAVLHKCDKCDFTADLKAKVRRHAWSHLRDELFELCSDGGGQEVNRSIGKNGFVRCRLCNGVCRAGYWNRHLKENHDVSEIGVELFTCHVCGAGFFEEVDLQKHIALLHRESSFRCKGCRVVFETEDRLAAHMVRKHPGGEFSKLICEYCGLSFVIKSGLNNHCKKFHSAEMSGQSSSSLARGGGGGRGGATEVECKVCGVKLVHVKALRLHQSSAHPELYRHKCEQCDAKYQVSYDLEVHVAAKHGPNRKHPCSYCLKEYGSKKSLEVHWKSHCKKYPGQKYKAYMSRIGREFTPSKKPPSHPVGE